MGPRHFSRGILQAGLTTWTATMLQWGRGISAAESVILIGECDVGLAGFNGAAAFQPRNLDDMKDSEMMGELQWGRGISAAESWHWLSRPSSWSICFNGAAAFQPRNPPRSNTTTTACRCFNGAAAFQPRNPLAEGPEQIPPLCFNGAAAFQPRNPKRTVPHELVKSASMGPRHFSRGISCCMLSVGSLVSLQWGRGISAAESGGPPNGPAVSPTLQWGRGISAAESSPTPIASMKCRVLQWGRGISAAESGEDANLRAENRPLQWGRGISAAESQCLCNRWPKILKCFNGAAAFQPRNPEKEVEGYMIHMSFNGAAAFQPRNHDSRCMISWANSTLQWGRGISAAESRFGTTSSPGGVTLQWGRGISAAESGDGNQTDMRMRQASMGPRHFSRGIRSCV